MRFCTIFPKTTNNDVLYSEVCVIAFFVITKMQGTEYLDLPPARPDPPRRNSKTYTDVIPPSTRSYRFLNEGGSDPSTQATLLSFPTPTWTTQGPTGTETHQGCTVKVPTTRRMYTEHEFAGTEFPRILFETLEEIRSEFSAYSVEVTFHEDSVSFPGQVKLPLPCVGEVERPPYTSKIFQVHPTLYNNVGKNVFCRCILILLIYRNIVTFYFD